MHNTLLWEDKPGHDDRQLIGSCTHATWYTLFVWVSLRLIPSEALCNEREHDIYDNTYHNQTYDKAY